MTSILHGFQHSRRAVRLAARTLIVYALGAQFPQPDGGPVEGGVLPARRITGGPKCMEVPDWQVQEYNQDFYILRESGCTHYEKPFLSDHSAGGLIPGRPFFRSRNPYTTRHPILEDSYSTPKTSVSIRFR